MRQISFNKMKKTTNDITKGVLIIVLATIILSLFLNFPKAVRVVDNDGVFCPKYVYSSYGGKIDFSLKLSNKGSGGELATSIKSEELLIRGTPSEEFEDEAERGWFVDGGEQQDFDFELQYNEKVSSFSIEGYFRAKSLLPLKQKFCCNYASENKKHSRYDLVDEICI